MSHTISQLLSPIRTRLTRTERAARRGVARCAEAAERVVRLPGRLRRR